MSRFLYSLYSYESLKQFPEGDNKCFDHHCIWAGSQFHQAYQVNNPFQVPFCPFMLRNVYSLQRRQCLENSIYYLKNWDTVYDIQRHLGQILTEIEEKFGKEICSYHIRKSHLRNGIINRSTSLPTDYDGLKELARITKMSIPLYHENKNPEDYSLTLRDELIERVLEGGDYRMVSKRNSSTGRFTKRQEEIYVVYIDYKFIQHTAYCPPQWWLKTCS